MLTGENMKAEPHRNVCDEMVRWMRQVHVPKLHSSVFVLWETVNYIFLNNFAVF